MLRPSEFLEIMQSLFKHSSVIIISRVFSSFEIAINLLLFAFTRPITIPICGPSLPFATVYVSIVAFPVGSSSTSGLSKSSIVF